jgi:hypothetical protein
VAIAMAASTAIIPAGAAAEESTQPVGVGFVPTEEVDDQPTREPDPTGTTESESLPTEPVSTEAAPTEPVEEELPPTETPTQQPGDQNGDGRDDEAVAPGFVTLVIFTSDGNPTSADTFACVGSVCQPAGGLASGSKLDFPDIDPGWREVTVETGHRTGNASTSVQVATGQGARVELTLVAPVGGSRDDPDPTPVSATGPLRTAPARADSEQQPPWSDNNVVVSSMPVTGAASEAGSSSAPMLVASALIAAAAACAVAARWTSRSRPN